MAAKKKAEPKQEKTVTIGKVFGGSLNIRSKAGMDGKIKGQLPDGAQVEILEAGKEWHKIEGGYIMAKWVKLDA